MGDVFQWPSPDFRMHKVCGNFYPSHGGAGKATHYGSYNLKPRRELGINASYQS
jgi:hypothetical protein